MRIDGSTRSTRRARLAITVAAVLLAACGGGDADTDDAADTTDTATESVTDDGPADDDASEVTDEPTDDDAAADDPPAEVEGIGEASVTVDGTTHAFGSTGFAAETCNPDQFGIFFVVLQQLDDSGAAVDGGLLEAILVREGSAAEQSGETDSVTVTLGDQTWVADAEEVSDRDELDEGQSQVDSTEIGDTTASGTATFYEEESLFEVTGGQADEVTVAEGTFDITCAAAG